MAMGTQCPIRRSILPGNVFPFAHSRATRARAVGFPSGVRTSPAARSPRGLADGLASRSATAASVSSDVFQ